MPARAAAQEVLEGDVQLARRSGTRQSVVPRIPRRRGGGQSRRRRLLWNDFRFGRTSQRSETSGAGSTYRGAAWRAASADALDPNPAAGDAARSPDSGADHWSGADGWSAAQAVEVRRARIFGARLGTHEAASVEV